MAGIPAEIWVQYSIVGILIVAAGVIAAAFYRLWHELLDWIGKQDEKREEEREKQRSWEDDQAQIRDQRWQAFFQVQEAQRIESARRQAELLDQLSRRVEALTIAVNQHDTWARASGAGGRGK